MADAKDDPAFLYFPTNYRWSMGLLICLSGAPWTGVEIGEVNRVGRALADKVGDAAGPETQAFAAAGTNALVFAFALPPNATFTGPWTIDEYRTTDAGTTWQTVPLQP